MAPPLALPRELLSAAITAGRPLAAQFPQYGLRPAVLETLAASVESGAPISDPAAVSSAFLTLGIALRHGAPAFSVDEQGRAAELLVEMARAVPPGGLDHVPALYRDPRFWTGQISAQAPITSDVESFDALLTDPALEPIWQAIREVVDRYRRETIPLLAERVRETVAFVSSLPSPMRPEDFDRLWEHQRAFAGLLDEPSVQIDRLLRGIFTGEIAGSRPLSEGQRETVIRFSKFLGHDLSNMLPWLWEIPHRCDLDGTTETASIFRTATAALKALYAPENSDTIVQMLSFPIEILADLHALATGSPNAPQPVNLFQASLVSIALVSLRLLPLQFRPRTVLQNAGLQPDLAFSLMAPGTDAEGFFVSGDREATVVTHRSLLLSVIYNAIKNGLFAVADRFAEEDPNPDVNDHAAGDAWKERQRTALYKARIRFEAAISTHWQGRRLDNVQWLTLRDSAGGFELNKILNLAMGIIEEELSTMTGVSRPSLRDWIVSLPIGQRPELVRRLKDKTGLRNFDLVQRLLDCYLNPRLANRFSVEEIIDMAAIFRLSGRMRKSFTTSGFGLFGISSLSPTAGITYTSYLIADPNRPGTETIIATQSLTHLRHDAAEVRGLVETSHAA